MCKIFDRYRQAIRYLFFGGLSFGVNVSVFAFFHMAAQMDELIANGISWVATVLFVFFTNRIWVFDAPTRNAKEFLSQLSAFLGGRLATLALEEGILFLCIRQLHFPGMEVKITAQIAVVLSNYGISKALIFRRKDEGRG